MARTIIGWVVCALVLTGCSTTHELPPEGQRVPITQRAIAAIALEHLPDETTTRQATYTDKRTPEGLLGADLRFGGGGEYDGDLVRVIVQPLAEPEDPCTEYDDGCVELDGVTTGYGPHDLTIDALAAPDPDAWLGKDPCSRWDGPCREYPGRRGPLYLAWQPAAAGQDGVVWAASRRDDQVVAIRMTGAPIPASIADVTALTEWSLLAQLLAGGRIGIETVREVVDRGTDHETVPLSDRGSAVPVLDVISDPVEVRSPDLDASGLPEGTVGSDLTFGGDRPDIRVRVVPGRLDDPCDRAQCAPLETGVAGRLRLVWQEASGSDPGYLYVVLWLDGQTVVVEERGPTIDRDPRELELHLSVDGLVRTAESPYVRLQTYRFVELAAQDIDAWTDEPVDY